MAKIGSLEVRTIGTGANRVKVVKFPGHEFPIEHFLPENLERIEYLSTRVRLVRSKPSGSQFFVVKKARGYHDRLGTALTPISEARLAMALNQLNLHKTTKFEEPLAVIMKPNGRRQVVYRKIDFNSCIPIHGALKRKLLVLGIRPIDGQAIRDMAGNTHIIDLEYWQAAQALKRKLKLKFIKE